MPGFKIVPIQTSSSQELSGSVKCAEFLEADKDVAMNRRYNEDLRKAGLK